MIPYSKQDIRQQDIDAVIEVLQSDWLTQGPAVPRFEQDLAEYTGAQSCVAVANGTAALHLACLALGLGEGDWLWTSSISFVASANCARYCGASVDFVDIDCDTANLCVQQLESRLKHAEREKRLPKIVVVVHMAGQPCPMKPIRALSERFGFRIIEDASHAVGASYEGRKIGTCQYSDLTVFSFHPVKIMTCGEGGAVLGNDAEIMERVRSLRQHGIVREADDLQYESHGDWYYEQQSLGFNYRLTDMQAALGRSQLKRVDDYVATRNRLAKRYDELLQDLPFTPLRQLDGVISSYHLYVVRAQSDSRKALFDYLRSNGVGAQIHYIPIHTQPYYRELGFDWGQFPAAEAYYQQAISLPLYVQLTPDEQARVVTLLREFRP